MCLGRTDSPRGGPAPRRPRPRAGSRGRGAPDAGLASMRARRDAGAVPGRTRRRARAGGGRSWLYLSDVFDQALPEPVISSVDRGDGGEALEGRPFQGLLDEAGGHAIELGDKQVSVFGGPGQKELLSPAQLLGRDRL